MDIFTDMSNWFRKGVVAIIFHLFEIQDKKGPFIDLEVKVDSALLNWRAKNVINEIQEDKGNFI